MIVDETDHIADNRRRQSLVAAGGLISALAASSCCIFPLALFVLGVSGAWIGNFTRLAPYQPYFIAGTLGFLGYGYWLVYRSATRTCADGEACARRLPNRIVKTCLVLATILRARARTRLGRTALSQLVTGEFPMNKLLADVAFAVGIIASPAVMAADRTVTLAVSNMYCAACPSIVKSSLEAVPGVAKVAVSYKDKTATVIYDDAKADVSQLTSATTKAGYPSAPKS
jgi:mercuric ion transport protein